MRKLNYYLFEKTDWFFVGTTLQALNACLFTDTIQVSLLINVFFVYVKPSKQSDIFTFLECF